MLSITIEIPGVKLGVLEAEGVRVEVGVPELARELELVCKRLRRELTVEQVAQLDSIRNVRAMFRGWGLDPARYRPSSEALLRRVAQGKGLYRVSNVVDAANLGSVETGWPYGIYDRAAVSPPAAFRSGRTGETYEGIGRHTWHVEGRPVLADTAGPFGSPISDSTRTMVRDTTAAVMAVIYAPPTASDAEVQKALEQLARRLERFADAHRIETALLAG